MTELITTEPYWDPYHADQREAPYDTWRRLRDEAPVYHNERYGFWALSRFADVLAASLDTETFSSARGITLDSIGDPIRLPMMIMMDPPLHDAFRRVVSRAYTPRRIASLEDRIRQLCADYLDPFVGAGGFDFVEDFGMRLPVMVISTLLGFPEEDHDQLREWSDIGLHREEGKEGLTPAAVKAQELTVAYYGAQVAERRREPRDDLISALVQADLETPDGVVRKLDDLEVMGMMSLISNAGNETVARLLGWAALVLDDYPDARRQMAEDPSLIPGGVEELLRYEAPSPIQGRYVTRDVEMHGTVIPEGAKLALLTGSAGRDERKYPDPDTYDIHRLIDRHVTLGYGAHYCLGAALARMEGKVAFTEVLSRFPTWEVDRAGVRYVATNTVRGPSSVPVRV
ncbi:MAG TPA: cytochrome P450 [Acidimicrobiales bacterium]|nr:cytochrome P450 [Acidimicrobiales bacterium]